MQTEEQTICPKCKGQFSQQNLPRLLTMCGHTFCQKCTRDLMIKKKMNNKYKVMCPLDKIITQLPTSNPSSLPKNLSVLNLAKKKRQSNKVSINGNKKSCQILTTIQIPNQPLPNNQQIKTSRGHSKSSSLTSENSQETCLLHQKPLELVCLRDFQKICSSCVIFGKHKGHSVKKTTQVDQQIKNLIKKFQNYLKQQKSSFKRLQSNQISTQVEDLVEGKKKQLQKQITKKFKELSDEVISLEKATLRQLDKIIEQQKSKISYNLFEKLKVQEIYQDWQQTLSEKISSLSSQNEEERYKTALKSQNFLQVCEKNITTIKDLQLDFLQETMQMLKSLVLTTNDEKIKRYLKDYCYFQDLTNHQIEINSSRVNITELMKDEILLDNDDDLNYHFLANSFVKPVEAEEIFFKTDSMVKSALTKVTSSGHIQEYSNKSPVNKLKRVQSSTKQNFFINPNRKSGGQNQNKVSNVGSKKPLAQNEPKSKPIPSKYEQNIQNILKGKVNSLDLTNAELGNEAILSILERIKKVPVTTMKLIKNGLTDEYIVKLAPYLEKVTLLNLSKNELSEKSLDALLSLKKEGQLKSLKSLVMSQNKKIQKKNKQKLLEFKKLGINLFI